MKILALETSALVASTAIVEDEKLIAEYTLNYKLTHSQTILPMIDEICNISEQELSSFDYIACAQGPGSFTGLRIGAATAKGLAYSLNIPIVPVPTLDALAYNVFDTKKIICPIMDARRKQVYTAFYRFENQKLICLKGPAACSIEETIEDAKNYHQEVIFVGDGVPAHKQMLLEYSFVQLAPAGFNMQRAVCVANLAIDLVKEGKTVEAHQFAPFYLRKPQAQREREEKQKSLFVEGDL